MSVSDGMKHIISGIQGAARERHVFVEDVRKSTKELLQSIQRDLKEMAADLRKFLDSSEQARKEEYQATMKEIAARLRGISRDTQSWLKECNRDQAAAHAAWQAFAKKAGSSAGTTAT